MGVGQWGSRLADKVSKLTVDNRMVSVVAHARDTEDPITRFGTLMSVADLISSDAVDAVIIAAPPTATLLAAAGAIERGKAVLATKPFLYTKDDPLRSPLYVDLVRLWSPCWRFLKIGMKDHLAKGFRPVGVEVRFGGRGPIRKFQSIYDYGPHIFAFLYDLFGTDEKFQLDKVMLDEGVSGGSVYTFSGKMGDVLVNAVTGNGLDTMVRHFRVIMNDGSFFCYMEEIATCAFVGPGTENTKEFHVEWKHDPMSVMLANFLLDVRLGVIDERSYTYSRLGMKVLDQIQEASVAG